MAIGDKSLEIMSDERFGSATCPLCQSSVRLVIMEDHTFGELGMFQCDECGSIIDVCNQSRQKLKVIGSEKLAGNLWVPTVRSLHGMIYEVQKRAKPAEGDEVDMKQKEADNVAYDEAKVKCAECNERFKAHDRAKSEATRLYCSKCRADIPKDDIRWVDDAKRARDEARKKKASSKGKSVKRKAS